MTTSKNYKRGDLVTIGLDRKFPMVLREGPGYTFARIVTIDPGDVGIIVKETIGHGSSVWIMVHVAEKEKAGWIPKSMLQLI